VPVMTLRGRGRQYQLGVGYRVCSLCGRRCIYASVLVADLTAIAPELRVGAILCDFPDARYSESKKPVRSCLKARPEVEKHTNPLPVRTPEQARREARPKRVRTRRCGPCGGMGCRRCKGEGRVAA
jgi:hypothetical protein